MICVASPQFLGACELKSLLAWLCRSQIVMETILVGGKEPGVVSPDAIGERRLDGFAGVKRPEHGDRFDGRAARVPA